MTAKWSDDIVGDIIRRFLAVAPETFSEEVAISIESEVRQHYGGGEVYVAKTGVQQEEAKRRALEEVDRGTPPAQAASRNGISRAAMYRLLKR